MGKNGISVDVIWSKSWMRRKTNQQGTACRRDMQNIRRHLKDQELHWGIIKICVARKEWAKDGIEEGVKCEVRIEM